MCPQDALIGLRFEEHSLAELGQSDVAKMRQEIKEKLAKQLGIDPVRPSA